MSVGWGPRFRLPPHTGSTKIVFSHNIFTGTRFGNGFVNF
jgi:hypothetical protein